MFISAEGRHITAAFVKHCGSHIVGQDLQKRSQDTF